MKMKNPGKLCIVLTTLSLAAPALISCSSAQKVGRQEYAALKSDRTFEHEFPVVWAGIENALKNIKVVERDPAEVDPIEMKRISERELETDWIYSRSRDKFHEYKVNGFPKKQYLQIRYKYDIEAKRVMGGTHVTVKMTEEIERLKEDGSSAGFDETDQPDTSRTHELLEKIQLGILSAAP